ncbi:single-stranded DNA-binding protein [Blastococcus mobilis]|uniref:Single-strand DNA-binding protein n=1 Tax=Blastococcus mobilis TaxID=1938746 RepID=A0A238ZHZ2_9ACTN|nr:single-stranded DNA-binding protein [Blastococcus mobilis]SNR82789.1 single-strand DNA-binding protein [Blastococcus mobilis]
MNDTELTVVGNVVDSPRRVRLENSAVTNFRMASTARRFDSGKQEFVDAGTLWVDVEAWGELGGNVARSISKGDPVIVRGTLTTRSWESEQGRRSAPQIKANAVGPNLARGWSDFHRPARPVPGAATDGDAPVVAPSPAEEELARDLAEERGTEDYTGGAGVLYDVNPDELSPEPAHA